MSTNEFYNFIDDVQSPLKSFAMSLTKDFEDSKDLFQETVYKALKNKEKFRIGTNFKAWIMTLMRNTFINNYRRKKRIKTQFQPSDSFHFEMASSAVLNKGESNMANAELMKILDSIDEKLRKPFWMYYLGMSYNEIAEALETPLGTVKSRIFFARKELQEKITALQLR